MASIVNDGFLRFVLRPWAGHNYLARNLVFYTSWHVFGLHAAPYFLIVLLTHLVNVWLLFGVIRTLTSSAMLACLGAALWGTSPIASATLGWYSVFGQVMAGTVFLAVLDRLVVLARAGAALPAGTAWAWYALLLVGTTCFGVGIGVALAFPLALFVMLPAAWRQPRVRAAFLALPAVTLVLYVALRRFYAFFLEPLSFQELAAQPAGVRELPLVLTGVWKLVAVAASEYPRSFFWAARAYPDRASSIVLLMVGAAVGAAWWRGRRETRRTVVALAALCFTMYFVIALGRAWLPLAVMVGQARYHYVAAIPIVVVICVALQEIGRLGPLRRLPRIALAAAALGLGVWGFARSTFRIEQYGAVRATVEATLRGIATEAARHAPGETVYLENGTNSAVVLGVMTPNELFPGRAAIFLLANDDDRVDGRPVRFVERDRRILTRYQQPPSRLGHLLVPPRP